MDPATMAVISTGLSVFGAFQQYEAGQDAADEAEALSEQQQADERNRAAAEQAERRARAAASGIQSGTGSSALFMEQAKKQDDERLRWMKRTGKARAKSLEKQGTAGAAGSLAKIPGYWI